MHYIWLAHPANTRWNRNRRRLQNNMSSRRDFLKVGCCSLGKVALTSSFARLGMVNAMAQSTGADYKSLVCVFFFGGNDSNNVIVPLDARYQQYSTIRANIAIPQASLLAVQTPQGTPYGLHPALAAIQPLWAQKRLAVL